MAGTSLQGWRECALVLILMVLTTESFAHPGHGGGGSPSPAPAPSASSQTSDAGYDPSRIWVEDPYDRQKHCPVTGKLLGLHGKAVAVNTGVGEKQPSRLGKLFGQQPMPGQVIYVCCPACVAKVKADPAEHYFRVIRDRADQTTIETPQGRPAAIQPCAAYNPDARQKTCPVTGQTLGSMGPPVSVRVGSEIIYLCCRGCVAEFQRDPAAHLARARAEKASLPAPR